MILIKRKGENPYNIYNTKERSRSASWFPTLERAISHRFEATRSPDYSDISLEHTLAFGGNSILWHIPISETTTEDDIKQQHPELFI